MRTVITKRNAYGYGKHLFSDTLSKTSKFTQKTPNKYTTNTIGL